MLRQGIDPHGCQQSTVTRGPQIKLPRPNPCSVCVSSTIYQLQVTQNLLVTDCMPCVWGQWFRFMQKLVCLGFFLPFINIPTPKEPVNFPKPPRAVGHSFLETITPENDPERGRKAGVRQTMHTGMQDPRSFTEAGHTWKCLSTHPHLPACF